MCGDITPIPARGPGEQGAGRWKVLPAGRSKGAGAASGKGFLRGGGKEAARKIT